MEEKRYSPSIETHKEANKTNLITKYSEKANVAEMIEKSSIALDKDYENILCNNSDKKQIVYQLRYEAYLSNNSIEASESKQFYDNYDLKQNCPTYLTLYSGDPLGSIRACMYIPDSDWNDIPANKIFNNEIKKSIGLDKTIVESNKFTVKPKFQRHNVKAKISLFGNIFFAAQLIDADFIITAVRKSQARFYKAMFFEAISEEKEYPPYKFKTVLLACPYKSIMADYLKDQLNPKYKIVRNWNRYVSVKK